MYEADGILLHFCESLTSGLIKDNEVLIPVSVTNLLQNIVLVEYIKKIQTQRDTKLEKGRTF